MVEPFADNRIQLGTGDLGPLALILAYGEWRARYRGEIETLDLAAAFVGVRDRSPGRDVRFTRRSGRRPSRS